MNVDINTQYLSSTGRLVSEGNLICLTTKEFPEYIQNTGDGYESRTPIVYYKITKILPAKPHAISYLASLHTNVFQVSHNLSFFIDNFSKCQTIVSTNFLSTLFLCFCMWKRMLSFIGRQILLNKNKYLD